MKVGDYALFIDDGDVYKILEITDNLVDKCELIISGGNHNYPVGEIFSIKEISQPISPRTGWDFLDAEKCGHLEFITLEEVKRLKLEKL